jgi:hypothetical protein
VLEDNGTSKLTIEPQKTLSFNGGIDGNAYFNSRPVVIKSSVVGTGAIGEMRVTSKTFEDGNITLERFIPKEGGRRWNLLTFGVTNGDVVNTTSTIRDAWGGGARPRVSDSKNRGSDEKYDLGNPGPKPFNVPWPMWITPYETFRDAPLTGNYDANEYVPYDGTLITGHRNLNAAAATPNGFDWWPELVIPAGEYWWVTPTQRRLATGNRTSPASIRPYRPNGTSDFGPERGTEWYSNAAINTGFNGGSIVNVPLSQAEQGYMLFTHGDRRVLENWNDSTTLRPTGQIRKLAVEVPISPSQPLTVVGNPYPAPVSLERLYTLGGNADVIEPEFLIWDSWFHGTNSYGGYRAMTRVDANTWITAPGNDDEPPTENYNIISSSQAFMVKGKENATSFRLLFNETVKAGIDEVDFLPFEEIANTYGVLHANLNGRTNSGSLNLYDGVAIVLNDKFGTAATDINDIRKPYSLDGIGNAMSLNRNGTMLAIEAHPNPKAESVFPLETPSLTATGMYAFTFKANNLTRDGREARLRDKFLQTETPVQLEAATRIDFEGTQDEGSTKPDRFEIVFKQGSVLPVTFKDITAGEIHGDVQVNWTVATEIKMSQYEVEHSVNGTEFGKATKVDAKNVSPASYGWLHVQPGVGDHYYRVRAINLEGRSLTTRIVKVNIGNMGNPEFKVFPTVVSKTRNVTVQMTAMEQGSYTLQVTDMSGRVISARTVEHAGGSASLLLVLPVLSKGKYNVRLYGTSGNFVEAVLQD